LVQSSSQAAAATADNQSSPQHLINEIKITMNKKVCELALNSYRNSDEFKQELKQLASQVNFKI